MWRVRGDSPSLVGTLAGHEGKVLSFDVTKVSLFFFFSIFKKHKIVLILDFFFFSFFFLKKKKTKQILENKSLNRMKMNQGTLLVWVMIEHSKFGRKILFQIYEISIKLQRYSSMTNFQYYFDFFFLFSF